MPPPLAPTPLDHTLAVATLGIMVMVSHAPISTSVLGKMEVMTAMCMPPAPTLLDPTLVPATLDFLAMGSTAQVYFSFST